MKPSCRKHPHEPSITLAIRLAVALFGAKRVMTPKLRQRLELSGLAWIELAPVLARVRSIDGWAREFSAAADSAEAAEDYRRAFSFAFLGQLVLSPYNLEKARLQSQERRCHVRWRESLPGIRFESLSLCGGAIAAYRETPGSAGNRPTVLLLPPLASTKEELTILADALLGAGFPVLRFDLPGQGESPAPLAPDSELVLARALAECGATSVIAGGISLGAYFALRLAGSVPGIVRGVFGISPPAIVTPEQWSRQPEVIWQYLDIYFQTETRHETRLIAQGLSLDSVVEHVRCPVRLYHGARDRLSLPDASARYRLALGNAAEFEETLLPDGHACLLHLKNRIAPEVASWAGNIFTDSRF